MIDEPINITTDIPIAIREDIASFRAAVEQRFEKVDGRLTNVEEVLRKQRRDGAGMLVMMRATITDFDERVRGVEAPVTALEASKS